MKNSSLIAAFTVIFFGVAIESHAAKGMVKGIGMAQMEDKGGDSSNSPTEVMGHDNVQKKHLDTSGIIKETDNATPTAGLDAGAPLSNDQLSDSASGTVTGKRMHKPFMVRKTVDMASPTVKGSGDSNGSQPPPSLNFMKRKDNSPPPAAGSAAIECPPGTVPSGSAGCVPIGSGAQSTRLLPTVNKKTDAMTSNAVVPAPDTFTTPGSNTSAIQNNEDAKRKAADAAAATPEAHK